MDLELFPCSGGMAEGFRRAGVVFHLSFDIDPDACDSYEANLGHRPIQMDVRDLLRMARAGWRPAGGVRLLVADPPCTPWSRAGKRRGTADERDMLRETAALIEVLRPEAYLIGNVPGLDDLCNLGVVQEVIGGLSRFGYCTADYARLDAADFGVPQHRVRPFWFGHLRGPCVRWPNPTHGDPREVLHPHFPGIEPLKPWRTCREVLSHLSEDEVGRPVRVRYRGAKIPTKRAGRKARASKLGAPAGVVTSNQNGDGNVILLERAPDPNRPPGLPDRPSRAITTTEEVATLAWPWNRPATTVTADPRIAPPGHHDESGSWLTPKPWPWNRPATTILTGNGGGRLAPPGKGSLYSGERAANAIVLSERAAAILQGFPETWRFAGRTKESRWGQIGMAMPPGLAEAVARAVVDQLRAARPVRP